MLSVGDTVYLQSDGSSLPYVALVENMAGSTILCRWLYRHSELPSKLRSAAHDRPEPQNCDAARDVKTLAPFKRKKSSFPLVCPINLAPQAVLCLPEPYASLHTFAPLHCAVQSVYSDEYNDAGTMPSETVHTVWPVTALLGLMSIYRTTHRLTSLDPGVVAPGRLRPWVLFLPGLGKCALISPCCKMARIVAYVAGRTSAEPTHLRPRHETHTDRDGPFWACTPTGPWGCAVQCALQATGKSCK